MSMRLLKEEKTKMMILMSSLPLSQLEYKDNTALSWFGLLFLRNRDSTHYVIKFLLWLMYPPVTWVSSDGSGRTLSTFTIALSESVSVLLVNVVQETSTTWSQKWQELSIWLVLYKEWSAMSRPTFLPMSRTEHKSLCSWHLVWCSFSFWSEQFLMSMMLDLHVSLQVPLHLRGHRHGIFQRHLLQWIIIRVITHNTNLKRCWRSRHSFVSFYFITEWLLQALILTHYFNDLLSLTFLPLRWYNDRLKWSKLILDEYSAEY